MSKYLKYLFKCRFPLFIQTLQDETKISIPLNINDTPKCNGRTISLEAETFKSATD